MLDVPDWPGHRAGQHVDVRLTAEDGYQAQRSYSIASAPELDALELTVERLDDGEVSPYLTEEVRAGDELELRGPIGGHFTWAADEGGPLLLVARRLGPRAADGDAAPPRPRAPATSRRTCWSPRAARRTRSTRDELAALDRAPGCTSPGPTRARRRPAGRAGPGASTRRCSPTSARRPPRGRCVFVCGPTPFVERVADLLVDAGHDPRRIHAERFGPTGG